MIVAICIGITAREANLLKVMKFGVFLAEDTLVKVVGLLVCFVFFLPSKLLKSEVKGQRPRCPGEVFLQERGQAG